MIKYIVTFPFTFNEVSGAVSGLSTFEFTSEETARALVSEILEFRATGKKSSMMLYIEGELCGTMKNSTGVIYIDTIETKRVYKTGGLHDKLRAMKNAE